MTTYIFEVMCLLNITMVGRRYLDINFWDYTMVFFYELTAGGG